MKILSNPLLELHQGDALETLRELPADSVDCCITSPPYWGLRDYGTASWEGGSADCNHAPDLAPRNGRALSGLEGSKDYVDIAQAQYYRDVCGKCGAIRKDQQMGLEPSPFEYIAKMATVFDEVRRILKPTGSCWIVIGDSYAGSMKGNGTTHTKSAKQLSNAGSYQDGVVNGFRGIGSIKPKDLCGIPWRLAFALQDRGWYLRQDVIWAKPNPMPESVKDRCTRSHEYIFMLSKNGRYHFNNMAIAQGSAWNGASGNKNYRGGLYRGGDDYGRIDEGMNSSGPTGYLNRRDVWTIQTEPFGEAHFATFPTKLVELCILAGSPEGGMILDPFSGAGTTLEVALKLGRRAIGIELNPEYCAMIQSNLGLFAVAG